jgi:hypothetical protein
MGNRCASAVAVGGVGAVVGSASGVARLVAKAVRRRRPAVISVAMTVVASRRSR